MAVRRNDPYGAYNFLVDLGDGSEAGFQEVSGLSHQISVIEYREGADKGNAVRKLPGLHKVSDVTLKRGLVGGLELYQWLLAAKSGQLERRTVVIRLLSDDRSETVMTWKLIRAFPVGLTHGPLSATGSLVTMEELVLASEALELE